MPVFGAQHRDSLHMAKHDGVSYLNVMDLLGVVLLPLAAAVTACWIIGAAVLSRRRPSFRASFLPFYGLGIVASEPWQVGSAQELGMMVIMLIMLAIPIAIGCLIGRLLGAGVVSVVRRLRRHSAS